MNQANGFNRFFSCLWLFASFSLANVATAQVTVSPASPTAQETVRVRVASLPISQSAFDPATRRITMSNSKIVVDLLIPTNVSLGLPPPTAPLDMVLGQFPAGDYTVEVRRQLDTGAFESVGSAQFSVTAKSGDTAPFQSNTDLWWNPAESGWGFNVIQHGSGIIFATWFSYGPDNKATWYVIPEGHWVTRTQYVGPIYKTTGPVVDTAFDPSAVTRTLVGDAVLAFSAIDSNRMTLILTIDGKTITKLVQRQSF